MPVFCLLLGKVVKDTTTLLLQGVVKHTTWQSPCEKENSLEEIKNTDFNRYFLFVSMYKYRLLIRTG